MVLLRTDLTVGSCEVDQAVARVRRDGQNDARTSVHARPVTARVLRLCRCTYRWLYEHYLNLIDTPMQSGEEVGFSVKAGSV